MFFIYPYIIYCIQSDIQIPDILKSEHLFQGLKNCPSPFPLNKTWSKKQNIQAGILDPKFLLFLPLTQPIFDIYCSTVLLIFVFFYLQCVLRWDSGFVHEYNWYLGCFLLTHHHLTSQAVEQDWSALPPSTDCFCQLWGSRIRPSQGPRHASWPTEGKPVLLWNPWVRDWLSESICPPLSLHSLKDHLDSFSQSAATI